MTAADNKAHKRAWTIDRIAYAVLAFLAVAQMARIEKSIDIGIANDKSIGLLQQWAAIVGSIVEMPFSK